MILGADQSSGPEQSTTEGEASRGHISMELASLEKLWERERARLRSKKGEHEGEGEIERDEELVDGAGESIVLRGAFRCGGRDRETSAAFLGQARGPGEGRRGRVGSFLRFG